VTENYDYYYLFYFFICIAGSQSFFSLYLKKMLTLSWFPSEPEDDHNHNIYLFCFNSWNFVFVFFSSSSNLTTSCFIQTVWEVVRLPIHSRNKETESGCKRQPKNQQRSTLQHTSGFVFAFLSLRLQFFFDSYNRRGPKNTQKPQRWWWEEGIILLLKKQKELRL
jgi:hypothetical protein